MEINKNNITDEQSAKLIFTYHLANTCLLIVDAYIEDLYRAKLFKFSTKHSLKKLQSSLESYVNWIHKSYVESNSIEGSYQVAELVAEYFDLLDLKYADEKFQAIIYNSIWWEIIIKSDLEFFTRFKLYEDYKISLFHIHKLKDLVHVNIDEDIKSKLNRINSKLMYKKECIYKIIKINIPEILL